jgi:pimeloyl-ACP methyl ester carboxylesterase
MNASVKHYIERAKHGLSSQTSPPQRRASLLLGAGAALAAMAVFVQYRTRQAERANPPAGNFIEIDGVRLHYAEHGQGQPVVLIHGNGTMGTDFDVSGLVDLAAAKYRVIVFDRPGYGYSDRPRDTVWDPQMQAGLLYRALRQLNIERPIVVGHSWGALVAAALGIAHRNYVKSLVLLSGYFYPTPRLDVVWLSPPAIPIIGDLMRYTVSPMFGRLIWPVMLRKLFAPAKTPERFTDNFPVWMVLRPKQIRAVSTETAIMIPSAYKLSKRYRELAMPVVIMAGEADLHVLSKLHSERLHQELPQSDFIGVSGVGHMVHHTVPHQVLSAIDKAAGAHAAAENDREYAPAPDLAQQVQPRSGATAAF